MKSLASAGPLAIATLVTLAAAPVASAGGYVSLGIGDGADLHGDLGARYTTDGDTSLGRLAVGQRTGPFAIEASLFGTDLRSAGGDTRTLSLGVDVKYFHKLGGGFELFGRGGLNKTWLDDHAGRGKLLGAGVQYRFTTGLLGEAAVFADLSRQFLELHDEAAPAIDGEIDMLQFGLSVGL
jgi:hypothetical protein